MVGIYAFVGRSFFCFWAWNVRESHFCHFSRVQIHFQACIFTFFTGSPTFSRTLFKIFSRVGLFFTGVEKREFSRTGFFFSQEDFWSLVRFLSKFFLPLENIDFANSHRHTIFILCKLRILKGHFRRLILHNVLEVGV